MKRFIAFIFLLLVGISSVNAADITVELCEYSEEYKAWLNLSKEEQANTVMPSMCKQEVEGGIIGSSKSYSMERFTLQDKYVLNARNQGASDDNR